MNNETVLVTGASSGIGRELAKCFAKDGCRMILVSRKEDALETLATELRKEQKAQAQVFTVDLASPEAPVRSMARLEKAGIRVDVLVNNAGFGAQGKFAQLDLKRQLEMIQVNVTALVHLTGLMLPRGCLNAGREGFSTWLLRRRFSRDRGWGYITRRRRLSCRSPRRLPRNWRERG